MAEYIERERAIDALERIDWYHINDRGRLILGGSSEMETYVPFKTVEDMLKSIPAADVRPVVLCRDCLHYEMGVCLKIYDDGAANKDAWQERKLEDFCSYGEKREES